MQFRYDTALAIGTVLRLYSKQYRLCGDRDRKLVFYKKVKAFENKHLGELDMKRQSLKERPKPHYSYTWSADHLYCEIYENLKINLGLLLTLEYVVSKTHMKGCRYRNPRTIINFGTLIGFGCVNFLWKTAFLIRSYRYFESFQSR